MSALLKLRPYQRECIEALHTRWDAGDIRVPSVMATGLGKTVVFAHTIEEFLAANPDERALVLVHTDELANQAAAKVRQVAPHRTVGIVKGARNEINARVIVASRQTLARPNRREQIRSVGLIIVDECHHATKDNTYGAILQHFGAFDQNATVKVAGFTATLARGDSKKLVEVWQPGKTFVRDIAFGIRHGFLLDVKGQRVIVPDFDLKHVKKQGGDYQAEALADELIESYAPEVVARAYQEHASDRQGIVFVPNVASAYVFAEAFNELEITAEVIHGALPQEERRLILKRLYAGDTQVIVNCMVLTEGFDAPCVSCIVIARPTRSAPLYQQMVGRALRPQLELAPEDRGHALVLDVVGAGKTHDLRSLLDLSLPDDNPYGDEQDGADAPFCLTCEMERPCLCVEEEGEDKAGFEPELYTGPVEYVEFDPLGRDTDHAWNKTEGGTFFLAAGKNVIVFLMPEETPGEYAVAWCTARLYMYAHLGCEGRVKYFNSGSVCLCPERHAGARGGYANGHRNLSLEAATAWGTDVALEMGGTETEMLSSKNKAWRKSKIISDAQRNVCLKEGIEITEGMRKGEVSDAIDRVYASRRVDPVVGALMAMREAE